MGEAAYSYNTTLDRGDVERFPSGDEIPQSNIVDFFSDKPKTFTELTAQAFTPLIVILLILQLFDGLLTGFGVSHFGSSAEGNPILRALMHTLGFAPAIIIAKLASCAIIIVLAFQTLKIFWLRSVLRVVATIYIFAAILPWTMLLCSSSL